MVAAGLLAGTATRSVPRTLQPLLQLLLGRRVLAERLALHLRGARWLVRVAVVVLLSSARMRMPAAAVVAVQVRQQQPVAAAAVMGLELAWQVSAQQQAGLDNQRAVPVVGQVLPGAEQPHHFTGVVAVAVQRLV